MAHRDCALNRPVPSTEPLTGAPASRMYRSPFDDAEPGDDVMETADIQARSMRA